jgi:NAD(P)-dependent dehydrogenase (short-subunit alcohol dehydrogenase family)
MGQLDGKVAIVTGGGSGIGKGIARAFAGEGCTVVLAARNDQRLEAAATALGQETGALVAAIPTDVTDEQQVAELFRETMARYGRLDILVNNAAAFGGGRVDQVSTEIWKRAIDVGVTGAFLCSREAFRIMKDAGGGRILNIGSISAQMPRMHASPYTTAKFAIWGLTKATALDGREFGIVASCLHPGNVMVERRAGGVTGTGRDEGSETMMSTETIARAALCMVTMPPDVNFLEAIVLPVEQTYLGRG